jgi:hypothetical protein
MDVLFFKFADYVFYVQIAAGVPQGYLKIHFDTVESYRHSFPSILLEYFSYLLSYFCDQFYRV